MHSNVESDRFCYNSAMRKRPVIAERTNTQTGETTKRRVGLGFWFGFRVRVSVSVRFRHTVGSVIAELGRNKLNDIAECDG